MMNPKKCLKSTSTLLFSVTIHSRDARGGSKIHSLIKCCNRPEIIVLVHRSPTRSYFSFRLALSGTKNSRASDVIKADADGELRHRKKKICLLGPLAIASVIVCGQREYSVLIAQHRSLLSVDSRAVVTKPQQTTRIRVTTADRW
jgi:hypothetical protein